MFAYTDESGNTGLQLFDIQQPVFSTLTLLTQTDIDPVLAPRHAEWLAQLGVPQLHANELGVANVERIASSARQFLELVDARFVLTFIHKPYFGAVKFADAVLDSGVNKAVSPIHYGIRALRLPLAAALVASTGHDDLTTFWDAWAKRNAAAFVAVLRRVRPRVHHHPDRRIVQLLDDALSWAEHNPAAVLDARRSKYDAPNVVALTLIVGVLHDVLGTNGGQVLRFVHDREQQFAKALKDIFDIVRQLAPKRQPVSSIVDFEIVKTFGCPIELTESSTSPTLQLVDCLLWLLRRQDLRDASAPECEELLAAVAHRTLVSEFSFQQLLRDIRDLRAQVNRLEITSEQGVKGQNLLSEFERNRQTRMKS